MFKLPRQNRSSKSGERVDFKFSNFQALQVPKGWDRLFLSMISVATGKTIAKLGKGMVRNGSCLWTETILESVWISKDDSSSKELEECLFKLVVSMGSSRAGILGEAIINLSSYMSSKMSSPVSLPLRKCNHGTTLQVKVQCLTPRPNLRQENPRSCSSSPVKDQPVDYQDTDHKQNTSDDSAKVSPSHDFAFTSNQGKYDSEESSCAESVSNQISNHVEGSEKGDNINLIEDSSNSNGYIPPRRHIGASPKSSSSQDEYPPNVRSLSNQSSRNSEVMNSRMDLQSSGKESGAASSRNAGSKDLLEAAEVTIDELRAEAKMWERNARKLMIDLDMLRNEFLDQSKKQADLAMELSATYAECDGLKKEIEQLKFLLEESAVRERCGEGSTVQSEGLTHIQKELESEIKYQQESNANLSLQLRRSQESNVQLLSVLQDLEETIEQQKAEIEKLSALQLKNTNTESSIQQTLEDNQCLSLQLQLLQEAEKSLQMNIQQLEKSLEEKSKELEEKQSLNSQSLLNVEREYKHKLLVKDDEIARLEAKIQKSIRSRQSEDVGQNDRTNIDLIREIESLREKVDELERDCNELTDENLELLLKLKDSKNDYIEKCGSFSSISSEFHTKSASVHSEVSDIDYDTEIKKKVKEDQWTANEASEVFFELLKQAEVAFHHLMKPVSRNSSVVSEKYEYVLDDLVNLTKKDAPNSKLWAESIVKCFFELNKLLEDRIAECKLVFKHDELEIQNKNAIIAESEKNMKYHMLKIQEHESAKAELDADYTNLLTEFSQKRSEIEKLEIDFLRKEEETNYLIQHQRELELQITYLEKKKDQLEQTNKTTQRESTIASKCIDDLQNDLAVVRKSLDSHVSAKNILEKKASELEAEKQRLESEIARLEQENLQLQECIAVSNVQMRKFKEESEFCQSELKNSQSVVTDLQVQIKTLEIEMETQKSNIEQELHDRMDQLLEAQRDCECLRRENQELHASALRLGEECKILQKLNKELKKKELELHEHCVQLEARSERSSSECSKKIEAMGENLVSMMLNFTLQEKSLNSELDVLLQENRTQKEKLIKQESLWNQMHLEMSAKLENLQKEVEHLTGLLSEVQEEKKKVESEASSEISSLLADKLKLESTLKEAYAKVESSEIELNSMKEEYQLEVQRLKSELVASEQNQVLLMSENKRLLKQSASYRTIEEKLKTAMNDLELKLTLSNYENQQLREDNANMKIQYQRIGDLKDEVSVFKRKAEECRSENEKLEASLCKISEEYETLKAEKSSCFERILSLQEEMSEYENCKKKRMALEEKVIQLEDALLAKESLHFKQIDLDNELSEVKMANKQYQQKICDLEEAKAKYLEKVHALEKDLKLMEEKCNSSRKFGIPSTSKRTHTPKSKKFAEEALDMSNAQKIELQSFSSEDHSSERISSKKSMTDSPVVPKERYERTKSSLETELKDLRERYFHMSLRYAEVEAQREDLVMKLKASKTGKRWFS